MPKDIGKFGAYMYVNPNHKKGPRVMVFYYGKISHSEMYKYVTFDNFVDGPGNANKQQLTGILSHLFRTYDMYNGLKHSPKQMHDLFKDKVSKFYSIKWIEKNYAIVSNDLHNAGFI